MSSGSPALLRPLVIATSPLALGLALGALGALAGCGAKPPAPKEPTAKVEAPKPKCPADAESAPGDAKTKMASLEGEVRRCFALETGKGEATVRVEVTVSESGEVREASVGGDGHATATKCLVSSMRATKFAKFCGPDVAIGWTYALR